MKTESLSLNWDDMDVTKQEQQIVDEFKAVMKKYRHIGALQMVECVRIAWEKEIGYGTIKKGKPRNTQMDGTKVTVNDQPRTRRTGAKN
jgi:hypothetical protein